MSESWMPSDEEIEVHLHECFEKPGGDGFDPIRRLIEVAVLKGQIEAWRSVSRWAALTVAESHALGLLISGAERRLSELEKENE